MIFRNIEISYYVREKYIFYIGYLTIIVNSFIISIKVILLADKTSFETNEATVFQNVLLLVMVFSLRLL